MFWPSQGSNRKFIDSWFLEGRFLDEFVTVRRVGSLPQATVARTSSFWVYQVVQNYLRGVQGCSGGVLGASRVVLECIGAVQVDCFGSWRSGWFWDCPGELLIEKRMKQTAHSVHSANASMYRSMYKHCLRCYILVHMCLLLICRCIY